VKHVSILALVFAAVAAPATAVTVESATGDWSKLPHLSQRGYSHLDEKMQAKLFEIAQSQQCPTFLLNQGRLDFRVTFAVQYAADGTLSRLILPRLGCADAEGVTGGALLDMLQAGDYSPTGQSRGGWYEGELGFSFTGEAARNPAVVRPSNVQTQQLVNGTQDPNEVVCQKVAEIGSRLITKRICMSRAQWVQQERSDRDEINRLQTQRGCKDMSGC
jgi:hypothetical protein